MVLTGAAPGGGRPPTESPLRYSTASGRWVIVATVLGSGIAAIDASVVGIALPVIGRDFSVGVGALQWVVTAYAVTLAGFLLVGGGLSDRYGRRRVFQIGVIWFAVASLGCAAAPDAVTLVAARAVQGVGAALLIPGSLAIIEASFAEGDRSKAIGAWSGLGGLATAVAPFLGGWLISAVSWRLIFLINLPLAAAVAVISARHVPESRRPGRRGPLDVLGAATFTAGLVGVSCGLIEGPTLGWASPVATLTLAGGTLALAGFIAIEAWSADPMLPLTLFRSRQFSAANAVTFVVYAALAGALFLLPITLEQVAGYSPLQAGAALLPVTAIMLAFSARSGAVAARIGPRLQMTCGPLVIAAGLALLTRIDASGSYLTEVLPAVVVFGVGLAVNVAPLTATALAAAPTEQAGVASAVNNDVARAAGLVAVASLPALSGITGSAYLHPGLLAAGFRTAMLIAAVSCAAGGLLAAAAIRNPPRRSGGSSSDRHSSSHCALDAPPLRNNDAST